MFLKTASLLLLVVLLHQCIAYRNELRRPLRPLPEPGSPSYKIMQNHQTNAEVHHPAEPHSQADPGPPGPDGGVCIVVFTHAWALRFKEPR